MDQEVKQKWVEALRSGKYEQGYGGLCVGGLKGSRYCCLGVLCACLKVDKYGDPLTGPLVGGYLSSPLLRNLDLKEEDMDYLAGLNDREKATFSEIADYIEENL